MKLIGRYKQYLLILLFSLVFVPPSHSFSILAHEAIIDAEWLKHIRPLLLKKYPFATVDELTKAQAYAYGGSLVADMGYMPYGCPYFTNLLHYVRSGDFVVELVADAKNLNEYAFALGAVSHYMADKYGHALATNVSVALAYPNLKSKFGNVVTYDNDHTSHSSLEFAYDIIQTYKGHYATNAYHNFIGFEIATSAVERAFQKIYGQDLKAVFPNFQSAIATFRWGVRDFFPELAGIAWKSDKAGLRLSKDSIGYNSISKRMPRAAFDKQFGKGYQQSGFIARVVSRAIQRLPKIGPLKKMGFKYPGLQCEQLYLRSMDSIMVNYEYALKKAGDDQLALANIDYDTGSYTVLNEYGLADATYNEWLLKLQNDKGARITTDLKLNIIAFYQSNPPVSLVVNYNYPNNAPPLALSLAKQHN